jgi:hypothetical protein
MYFIYSKPSLYIGTIIDGFTVCIGFMSSWVGGGVLVTLTLGHHLNTRFRSPNFSHPRVCIGLWQPILKGHNFGDVSAASQSSNSNIPPSVLPAITTNYR